MVDVVFISPPRPYLVNPVAQSPLGILYLAAVCEAAGLEARIVNLSGVPRERWRNRVPFARCYGITGTFLDVDAVNMLVDWLDQMRMGARVLVGGPISLSRDRIDGRARVVHGEAENTIAGLVCGAAIGGEAESDVGALPLPARHLWAGPFGGSVFIGGQEYFGGGSTTLITQRGCPMSCAFCAGPALCTRKVRKRHPLAVVEEMEQCATDYGVRQFRLSDEYFTASPTHVLNLCDEIQRSGILGHGKAVAWRASIAAKPRKLAMFQAMRAAGCREVSLGVESADPDVLDVICPGKTDPLASIDCMNVCHEAGLRVRALMMIGTPGSRPETERLTLEFFERAPIDWLAVTVFQPIPGSAVATHPERYGCSLLREPGSLCLYGPDGENPLSPTIEVAGMLHSDLSQQIRNVVSAARATGKLGSG